MEPNFRKVIAVAVAWFVATIALIASCATAKGDCRRQYVVQQQVAYVAPIVYVSPVYYSAGLDYQIEAGIEKALRLREQSPSKGYQQPQQAPVQAPVQAPIQAPASKGGSLEPLQQVEIGLFARCIRCHKGESAAAGLRFDGEHPTTHENYRRFGEIFGLGENIPTKMAAVVPVVSQQERGQMNEWILRRIPRTAQPEPPVDRPPPPVDGGLQ